MIVENFIEKNGKLKINTRKTIFKNKIKTRSNKGVKSKNQRKVGKYLRISFKAIAKPHKCNLVNNNFTSVRGS